MHAGVAPAFVLDRGRGVGGPGLWCRCWGGGVWGVMGGCEAVAVRLHRLSRCDTQVEEPERGRWRGGGRPQVAADAQGTCLGWGHLCGPAALQEEFPLVADGSCPGRRAGCAVRTLGERMARGAGPGAARQGTDGDCGGRAPPHLGTLQPHVHAPLLVAAAEKLLLNFQQAVTQFCQQKGVLQGLPHGSDLEAHAPAGGRGGGRLLRVGSTRAPLVTQVTATTHLSLSSGGGKKHL